MPYHGDLLLVVRCLATDIYVIIYCLHLEGRFLSLIFSPKDGGNGSLPDCNALHTTRWRWFLVSESAVSGVLHTQGAVGNADVLINYANLQTVRFPCRIGTCSDWGVAARGAVVVMALCYRREGRGFETR
jgi:hypothetical protein